jgi:hypothetical protein
MINDNYKLDLVFKKLGFGVQSTSINKAGFEEAVVSPLPIYDSAIWAKASLIPSIAEPRPNVVQHITDFVLTQDITVSGGVVWLSNITDFIPPTFGSTYVVVVKDANDSRVYPGQSSFFFDYASGTLVFPNGASSYAGFTAPFKISAYRYIGQKGIVSTGGGELQLRRIDHEETDVAQDETREFWIPFSNKCYIAGIRVTGESDEFSFKLLTLPLGSGGRYIYYSGSIVDILWDIPESDIPFIDESGEDKIYAVLENSGAISDFSIQIYIKE